ncbi:TIGR01777 family oxidoreductase [Nocardioides daejeonensis]|uniref:TIGR01777 family oxidoreductase n=1 Tax=Nocardioides daejeonensis TaxID=1046556 RepID=UPI000D74091E|nr:TIGR01777 family oxidoreductase [Nocardioides daejeonensis]
MHVVVAGASGFLGSALSRHLVRAGHRVTALVRRPPSSADQSQWDPYAGEVDQSLVDSADAVVNLAGTPTMGNPHSARWAKALEHSRVTTTGVLATAVARAQEHGRGPAFVAGNGISWYGSQGDRPLEESAPSVGDAFLTEVTRVWEQAAAPAVEAGARVAVLRTAPVLDRQSPPLRQLALSAKLGLATRIGDGRQYFPVISRRDWVGGVTHVLATEVSGPVNLCCPTTPTNGEFTKALADAVHRPAFLFVPAPVVKVGAGRMAPEVLGSIRGVPAALADAGYEFRDQDVRDVLATGLRSAD